jgi:hypothetical protein
LTASIPGLNTLEPASAPTAANTGKAITVLLFFVFLVRSQDTSIAKSHKCHVHKALDSLKYVCHIHDAEPD